MHLQTLANVFENHNLTTILIDGKPWWIAKEVAEALGYEDPKQITKQISATWADELDEEDTLVLKGEELQALKEVLFKGTALHQASSALLLSEEAIWLVCQRTNLPAGKRLRRWLRKEVLPSIARTGGYRDPNAHPGFSIPTAASPETLDKIVGCMAMYDVVRNFPGVRADIAAACMVTALSEATGAPAEPMRKALPGTKEKTGYMNATELARKLFISSPIKLNKKLEAEGWQVKNKRGDISEWHLTEEGKKYGDAKPYNKNGHSGHQILWGDAAVDYWRAV